MVIISGGFLIFLNYKKAKSVNPEVEKLALCLKEKGAVMYGTYWCPHCKKQKEMFGEAFKYINYVECTEVPQKCEEAGIYGVPTWIFKNGTKLEGIQTLEKLKEVSGC